MPPLRWCLLRLLLLMLLMLLMLLLMRLLLILWRLALLLLFGRLVLGGRGLGRLRVLLLGCWLLLLLLLGGRLLLCRMLLLLLLLLLLLRRSLRPGRGGLRLRLGRRRPRRPRRPLPRRDVGVIVAAAGERRGRRQDLRHSVLVCECGNVQELGRKGGVYSVCGRVCCPGEGRTLLACAPLNPTIRSRRCSPLTAKLGVQLRLRLRRRRLPAAVDAPHQRPRDAPCEKARQRGEEQQHAQRRAGRHTAAAPPVVAAAGAVSVLAAPPAPHRRGHVED